MDEEELSSFPKGYICGFYWGQDDREDGNKCGLNEISHTYIDAGEAGLNKGYYDGFNGELPLYE